MATLRKGSAIEVRSALVMVSMALCTMFSPYAPSAEAAKKPAGIRALILSGLNNHEWRLTTPVLERMFKEGDRFSVVDVSEQPSMAIAETINPDAALKALAGYTSGQDPKIPYDIEQLVIAAQSRTDPGAAATRNELSAKIAGTLASHATPAAKEFLCRQISTLATEKQVPVLASLLLAQPGTPEAEVADAARGALEVMPGAAADAALLEALGKTSGSVKLGIVESLGERRASQAVGVLIPLLNDSDAVMASAAAAALGKIGSAPAEEKLSEVLATV